MCEVDDNIVMQRVPPSLMYNVNFYIEFFLSINRFKVIENTALQHHVLSFTRATHDAKTHIF